MNTRLFNRTYKLIVDNTDVTGLDIQFRVSKTVKPEPNKAEIHVFNLSPDRIAQLTKRAKAKTDEQGNKFEGIRVELSAGYGTDMPLIFRGDMREMATVRNGADTDTQIAGHDGGRSYRAARINQSFGPGTPVQSVLQACADAMGIGEGNIRDAVNGATIANLGSSYAHGTVLSGQASDELTRLLKAVGFTWSSQNNVLQVQKRGQPLQTAAVRLAPDTGLIGSPAPEIDASVAQPSPDKAKAAAKSAPKTPHTLVNVKALMIPGLYPGRKVVLDSADYKGGYQIMQADYRGDTAGNDWFVELKLKVY